jgi:hypothetical protein
VFQGVHMLFQGRYTNNWKASEKRENKFVFIGRNLPVERLQTEFDKLYAKDLRFPVGTRVLANVGSYVPAVVIKHWDDGHAYRLKLDKAPKGGDDEVWGMIDEDQYVKAFTGFAPGSA